jgi:hypothetical protein
MRRFAAVFAMMSLLGGPALARNPVPTHITASPAVLLAQIDDSDLKDEKSLEEFITIEVEEKSWSMAKAIGLSLIPGGGFGLIYAEKKAQAVVPFLLSAIGYGVGIAFLAGIFDEKSSQVCVHTRDGEVPLGECAIGGTPGDNQANDPRSANGTRQYFDTRSDYTGGVKGQNFNGFDTGVLVLGATYAVTTILGAVWAAATVSDHNDRVRKDAESTAEGPSFRPVMAYDGQNGLFGLGLDF